MNWEAINAVQNIRKARNNVDLLRKAMKQEPSKDPWPENYLQGEHINESDYMPGQMVFPWLLDIEKEDQNEKKRIDRNIRRNQR